jgi:hypothetical protein
MTKIVRLSAVAVILLLVTAQAATAQSPEVLEAVESFDYTQNMHPLGYSPRVVPFSGPGSGIFNTDLAFWGRYAYQGTYEGFRIIDMSAPGNPKEITNFTDCVQGTTTGNQGDVIIWDNILVRSWNSPTPAGGRFCGGIFTPAGQEGVHVFDVSDPRNPVGLAFVASPGGSHTATGVPDLDNDRLLVYNSPSSGTAANQGIHIIEVPLSDPASATYLHRVSAGRSCHDTGVILGDALLAACAGGTGFTVWSMDPADGGSLESPAFLYSRTVPLQTGHSASFTWDGEILVIGHEPGGGSGARCQATTPEVQHTMFFFEARTGDPVGQWTLPRKQTATENCTIHNYNIVPTDKRYVVVSGNYQAGISVVDFTDPANAVEIAYADPAPLSETSIILGGDWSSYWYNGFIYQSDIRRGFITWKLSDPAVAGAKRLTHLNPQTQEFTFPLKGTAFGHN